MNLTLPWRQNYTNFPRDKVTSHDLVKALALVTMIIDHIGHYIVPDQIEWRIIGRTSAPIWFFLVGYSNTRDLSKPLIIGGVILTIGLFLLGRPILPLNILFSILIVRFTLDWFVAKASQSRADIAMGFLCLFMTYLPFAFLFEYGSLALALAIIGYLARHTDINARHTLQTLGCIIMLGLLYSLYQIPTYFPIGDGFWQEYGIMALVMTMAIMAVILCLCLFFKPKKISAPIILRFPIHIMGRWTLEIYILHLLFLQAFFGQKLLLLPLA